MFNPKEWYAVDTETTLIPDSGATPKLVCTSIYRDSNSALKDRKSSVELWQWILKSETKVVFCNAPFDMLVARRLLLEETGEDVTGLIIEKYMRQEVVDVAIWQQLDALARGNLGKNPLTGKPTYYSLSDITSMVLGRDDAKANDEWRLQYEDLLPIPIEYWPEAATTYPIDDVRNTWEIFAKQCEGHRNGHDLHNQCFADMALNIGAQVGLSVDVVAIDKLEADTTRHREGILPDLIGMGFYSVNKKGEAKAKKAAIKREVAQAFGVTGECSLCKGTTKVPSTTKEGEVKYKKHVACKGAGCEHAECFGGQTYQGKKGCTLCSATGLDLQSGSYPMTKTGGVAAGRDALNEAGTPRLERLAEYEETSKILTTYMNWLRKGVVE